MFKENEVVYTITADKDYSNQKVVLNVNNEEVELIDLDEYETSYVGFDENSQTMTVINVNGEENEFTFHVYNDGSAIITGDIADWDEFEKTYRDYTYKSK